MELFRIVTDSSSDLFEFDAVPFATAPLKIITAEREYVDDGTLDVRNMVETLSEYKGKSSTSCPNPEDWLGRFGEAQFVFCVTITGTLSGSYNAALVAKELYEEQHPDRRVFVLNSLSAGPELKLMIEKIRELILAGENFDAICEAVQAYTKQTGLLFMLESMKNLANNGRVHSVVAKAVGLLGIRIVGQASAVGDLQPLDKCRGQEKAIAAIVHRMKKAGLKNGKVRIAHCFNESAAMRLKEMILADVKDAQIEIYECQGLCSFYAEKGGMLVGFEKR
ncbi:MAG: DegV family EDD domain-containing protein [Ruminococcaceae bacterium]|nr:DegV family EDD domain-containing protein [Oscillospiraceae bacterium]